MKLSVHLFTAHRFYTFLKAYFFSTTNEIKVKNEFFQHFHKLWKLLLFMSFVSSFFFLIKSGQFVYSALHARTARARLSTQMCSMKIYINSEFALTDFIAAYFMNQLSKTTSRYEPEQEHGHYCILIIRSHCGCGSAVLP